MGFSWFLCASGSIRTRTKLLQPSPSPQTMSSGAKFQSTFCYARISARTVREALIREKGYDNAQLPTRQTIGEILNRLGYRLKKHTHTKPLKKIAQTDAIFENVFRENQASDDSPKSLRLSIDTKARVSSDLLTPLFLFDIFVFDIFDIFVVF